MKDDVRANYDAWIQSRVETGRAALHQMSLAFPGGDDCPAMVIRGLHSLRALLEHDGERLGIGWSPEQQAALNWIDHWLDAGAAMIPRGDDGKG